MKSAAPGNKLICLQDFHDKDRKMTESVRELKNYLGFFPNSCTLSYKSLKFPGYNTLRGCCKELDLEG
jgi:hypothetical protein